MSLDHLVDPELLPALAAMPPLGSLSLATLPDIRALMDTVPDVPPVPGIIVEHLEIPGPPNAPAVPARLYRFEAAAPSRPALLHIHGGGYVAGSARRDDASIQRFAADIGCIILSVDYRLAPETPHPGPLDDCYAALSWLYAQAETLGIDPAKIAVRGNSAGGGLAAALALLARDRAELPPLAFQLLLFPMLDDRTRAHPFAGAHVWTPEANHFGWSCLLGHAPGIDGVSPYAAPARAENLAGLPPAFIAVGALDLFIEEDIEYARRLIRAGVPTDLKVYPGAYHGFNQIPNARIALACEQDLRNALIHAFTKKETQ